MSLFTRIIGTSEQGKISIHAIQSMVSEIECGRLSPLNIISEYNLTESEQLDLSRFLTLISNAINKLRTSARIFNYLCLGEIGVKTGHDYTDENLFWQMIESESNRP